MVPVSVAEELNDAIATSTLGLLPGCGHDLTDEAAATIAPMILEYLRARYLEQSASPRPTAPITRTTGSCGSSSNAGHRGSISRPTNATIGSFPRRDADDDEEAAP